MELLAMDSSNSIPSGHTALRSLTYRPDIDGLRAIAVIAVIVHHAFPKLLPGGFCGVDVFFVISGFLITSLLLEEMRSGGFSLANFYARRIRRIFPALVVALLLTMALLRLNMLPSEFRALGGNVIASVAFVQNFLLLATTNYFARAAELNPLLHIWSLAVEEQFYIFFPLILAWLARGRRCLTPALVGLMAISLAGSIAFTPANRAMAFYLLPFRAWELIAGAVLAVSPSVLKALAPRTSNALSLCGGLLLAASIAWLDPRLPYPSWRAVFPVAATVLLIAVGRTAWTNRLLSWRLAVGIGLISYPLYLFHWPLLVFCRLRDGSTITTVHATVALVVALALSVLVYFLVEQPVRVNRRRGTTVILCLAMLFTGILGVLALRGVVPVANDSPSIRRVDQTPPDDWAPLFLEPHSLLTGAMSYLKNSHTACIGEGSKATLFYGDSMAWQFAPRFKMLLGQPSPKYAGRRAIMILGGGFCAIPGVKFASAQQNPGVEKQFRKAMNECLDIDRVVITGLWTHYFSKFNSFTINGERLAGPSGRQQAIQALDNLMAELVGRGKRVTLVLPFPGHPDLAPEAFFRRGFRSIVCVKPEPLSVDKAFSHFGDMSAVREGMLAAARRHGVEVVDPLDFLSRDGVCIAEDDEGPIRYDMNHLRPSFVCERLDILDHTLAP